MYTVLTEHIYSTYCTCIQYLLNIYTVLYILYMIRTGVAGVCNELQTALGSTKLDCICQSIDTFCIAHDESHEMLNLWEYYGNTAPTEDPSFMEALGFQVPDTAVNAYGWRGRRVFYPIKYPVCHPKVNFVFSTLGPPGQGVQMVPKLRAQF